MPQLNPQPWFSIMMISWFIILTLIMLKMTKYQSTYTVNQKTPQKYHPSWIWPWH
uniref:ATP synthase complex subunit 8 n=1 Tax=Gymnopis multiplicata TaxID=449092 RepID=W5RH48_GYMMU|nr:ATP synthase F0 subunit 8 [Gymnopis multiplicata]